MNTEPADLEHWLPLSRAAEVLGSTSLNVLMHIKRGLLAGVESESAWLVDPASLEALVERRRSGGVPAICRSGCSNKAGGCGSCA